MANCQILKLVLQPLVENALYHGIKNKRGRGFLSVKGWRENNRLCFSVEDNGIGMDKNTLERITEIFYTTKASGNGLGVVLSKEIIEMHNGTINYKSTLGKGTTVTITLPNK